MANVDNMETGGAAIAQRNQEWYQGGKWCTSHGWCGHTTRGCQGVERRHTPGGGKGGVICYHCKSTSHLIKQCPTRPKRGLICWNCGGAHALNDCDEEFDSERIFASRAESQARWASKSQKGGGHEAEALASIQLLATLPSGIPCPAQTYVEAIVPHIAPGVDIAIQSLQEGMRLGFFSDPEAEQAYTQLEAREWPGFSVRLRRVGPSPQGWTPPRGWNPPTPGGPPPPLSSPPFAATSSTTTSPSSTEAPWAADIGKVNDRVARLEVTTDGLKKTVDEVRSEQKTAASSLRLMSLKMGIVEPDLNNEVEVRIATLGGWVPPSLAGTPMSGSTQPPRTVGTGVPPTGPTPGVLAVGNLAPGYKVWFIEGSGKSLGAHEGQIVCTTECPDGVAYEIQPLPVCPENPIKTVHIGNVFHDELTSVRELSIRLQSAPDKRVTRAGANTSPNRVAPY